MTFPSTPPHPESTLLAPRDPSITDSDEWPEFRLTDAYAVLPDTKDTTQPVSLLLASEHYPLSVIGRLQPPAEGQEHLWLLKDGGKKGIPIVVDDVRSFAYGAYEDGSVEIWAAGKSGWLVIQPGRAYRTIYQDMCAAVKMLFFVADAYTEPEPSRKRKNAQPWSEPNAEQVFEKYAREELGDETRSAEAAEAVYKHRDFLMSSMLAGKEGMVWGRNPMFRHLARKFAGELKAIRERLAAPVQQKGKSESKALAHARQGSIDSASTSSSLKRKRGRPPKNRPADVISIGSSSAASSMKKELPQSLAPARSEPQKSKLTSKSAPALSTRRIRNASQPIPRSETPEIQESVTPAQDSDSDDDNIPARSAGKGKSALRPKPSKPMKGPPKGPARSGKAPVQEEDTEPRSSPIPSKRRRDEPTTADPRRSKRRNSKQEVDEGIDIPTSPSTHSTSPDDADSDTLAGAADPHPSLQDSLAAHKPDHLQENTWLCALDGCTHKIYGPPTDPLTQRLIREHYALHAYDDDERVQLVKRLQAPSLPVGHLMERVLLEVRGEGFPESFLGSRVAGTRFPQPLVTKY